MPMVPLLDCSLLPNLAVTTLLNLLQIFLFKILVNIYMYLQKFGGGLILLEFDKWFTQYALLCSCTF